MNGALTQLLALDIVLTGADKLDRWIDALGGKMGWLQGTIDGVKDIVGDLATELVLLGVGLDEAMKLQTMQANLDAFTHSSEIAANQMELIDQIASEGIFKRDDIYKAIRAMDAMGISLEDNLDLVEKLGARMGSISKAADLITWIAGSEGTIPNLVRKLHQAGITPEMLEAQGLNVSGNHINNSKEEILTALNNIEKADGLLNKLKGTLGAGLGGFVYSFIHLLGVVVGPLVGPLTIIANLFETIFKWMDKLNTLTGGWAAYLIVGGVIATGLARILMLFDLVKIANMAIYGWQVMQATIQRDGIIWAIIETIAQLIKSLGLWIAQSYYAAVAAAAMGNMVPMGLWFAGAAAVIGAGVGLATGGFGGGKKQLDGKKGSSAESAPRRDDIERLYQRMHGDHWEA